MAAFLTELGDALHAHNMSLTICVASWSELLADYAAIASSSVDELQLMSTYARPGDCEDVDALVTIFLSFWEGGAEPVI